MKHLNVFVLALCAAIVSLSAYARPPTDRFDVLVGHWTCVGESLADPQNQFEMLGTWDVTKQADGRIRALYVQQKTDANPNPVTEVEYIGTNAEHRHYHTESISLVAGPTISSAYTEESNHGNHDSVVWNGRIWGALGFPSEAPDGLRETWTVTTDKNSTVIHVEVETSTGGGPFTPLATDDCKKSS